MSDGWWYIYLPFDKDWHFVRNDDVIVINETMQKFMKMEETKNGTEKTKSRKPCRKL